MTSSSDFWPKLVMASRSSSDREQQLADEVDLGPLEAVAGALGEIEILDREVEIGRAGDGRSGLGELEALGLVAHLLDQLHQGAQGGTGRGQRLARRDGPVGLDGQDQAVEVGGLLDPGGLDLEGHPADGREDRVDRDDPDGGRRLVAVSGDVTTTLADRQIDGQPALAVEVCQEEVAVENVDFGVGGDVRGRHLLGAAHVEPQDDGLFAVRDQHQILEIQDDVGDVLGAAGDGVEFVEGFVEAHLGHCGARDGREQSAAQRVAQRVPESGLERADGEPLLVVLFVVDGLDGGTLDHQHVRTYLDGGSLDGGGTGDSGDHLL